MIDLGVEIVELLDNEAWDHIIIRCLTNRLCFCRVPRPCEPPTMCDLDTVPRASIMPKADCPNCEGAGYTFYEILPRCKTFYTPRMVAHLQAHEHGMTYKNILVVYLPPSEEANKVRMNDRLFQIKTNLDGSIVNPIVRTREWVITDIYDMNLDNGKREFFKIHAKPILT